MPSEDSYKQIEGDWKDFRFRRILPPDYDAVYDHLANNYFRDEATSKLLGWTQEFPDNCNRIVAKFLPEGMCFLAEHIPTKEIAGVRITYHRKPDTSFDDIPIENETARLYLKYIGDLVAQGDIENTQGINSWVEFYIASTHRDFRNQGLAGEFYDRSIAFLKAEGHSQALVCVSSPYTKKATIKRGFKDLGRLDHKDFKDFDGKLVFKEENLTPEHFGLVRLINF